MKRITSTLIAVLLVVAAPAWADAEAEARERLRAFTEDLHSFTATFQQTLYDDDQYPIQERSGVGKLEKPGKFRWEYQEPYEQLIVSNGERMWMYEADLDQVTVREFDQALGQAPIALLSGDAPLEDQFEIEALGEREGLLWIQLDPKVQDTDFRRIYLGFDDTSIKVMELRDRFDGTTQVVFDDVAVNEDIAAELFEFEPPEGADVIGEDEMEEGMEGDMEMDMDAGESTW